LTDCKAVQVWHHHVQDNQVWAVLLGHSQSLDAVGGGDYLVSQQFQIDFYEFGDCLFVFNYEDSRQWFLRSCNYSTDLFVCRFYDDVSTVNFTGIFIFFPALKIVSVTT